MCAAKEAIARRLFPAAAGCPKEGKKEKKRKNSSSST